MKRFLPFLLFLSYPAQAVTPTISNTLCTATDRSVWCRWDTDQLGDGTRSAIAFDFEGDDMDFQTTDGPAASSGGRRGNDITSVSTGTTVYVAPRSRDTTSNWSVDFVCTGTCTNCGSSDDAFFLDNSGLDCDGIGEFPNITTLTLAVCEGGPPCRPEPPTHNGLTSCPAITGDSRSVLADGSDFLTQFNDAKADAAAGTVEEIIVPAGVAIRPEDQTGTPHLFTLGALANNGYVVIRPDSDPKLLPPPGTQVDPSYHPHMGRFEMNTNPLSNDRGIGVVFGGATNARGYCFENILFTVPPVADLPVYSIVITSVNVDTDVLTADQNLSSNFQNEMVAFIDLGSDVFGGQGLRRMCNISGNTFKITSASTGENFCGSTVNLTGVSCDTGTCGTAKHWIAKEIESISDTTPIEVTITDHGLPNFQSSPIDGSTDTTNVTISTIPRFSINQAVYIDGTGIGTCDGTWIAGVTSSSTVNLSPRVGSAVAADCTGATTGAIRHVRSIAIHETSDADIGQYLPVNWAYYATDADTILLLDSTAQGSVTGGVLFLDSVWVNNFIRSEGSSNTDRLNDLICDRCSFVIPWNRKGSNMINAPRSNRISVVNSWADASFWQRTNPVSGQREAIESLLTDGSIQHFIVSMSSDVQIINNTIPRHPMIFSDTPSNLKTGDFTVNQNVMWMDDWSISENDSFGGFYHGTTFQLEFKDMDRMEFVGNYVKGCNSVRNNSQACIEFSGIGRTDATTGRTGDINMSYNTFDRVGGAMHVTSDGSIKTRIHTAVERILMEHNLAEINGIDYNAIILSGGATSTTNGRFFTHQGGMVDVIAERNTYWPIKAPRPAFTEFSGNLSQGLRWKDNILMATEGFFSDEIGVKGSLTVGGRSPAPTQDAGSAAITEFFRSGIDPDSLASFSENVIIPGLESSHVGDYATKRASTADSDTISVNEASNKDELDMAGNDFVGITDACAAGTCPDSLADREAEVFEDGLWVPKVAYAGKGADIQALEDAQGWVTGITVTANDDSATVAYHAPTTDGCYVDMAAWDTDWATTWGTAENIARSQDASSSQSQSVSFNSLSPQTQYAYRINCTKSAVGLLSTSLATASTRMSGNVELRGGVNLR